MPTPTYIPLANVTLGASAATVTFSSIPATYRDLVVIVNGGQTPTTTPNAGSVRVNADSGANYSYVEMTGNGSSASSSIGTSQTSFTNSMVFQNQNTTQIFQFMDYSATDKHKTVLSRVNVASWGVRAYAGRWANTAAITELRFAVDTVSFSTGTTLNLYGIAS